MRILELEGTTKMWEEGGFRATKVEKVCIYKDNLIQYTDLCTTWSKILRTVRDYFRDLLEDLGNNKPFEAVFNMELDRLLDDLGIRENANFSRSIFTDDSYMNSSVYKNNKNHRLVLYKDNETGESKCICAVYIDEVIWVINTLIKVLNTLTDSEYKISIYYEHRPESVLRNTDSINKDKLLSRIDSLISEVVQLKEVVKTMK